MNTTIPTSGAISQGLARQKVLQHRGANRPDLPGLFQSLLDGHPDIGAECLSNGLYLLHDLPDLVGDRGIRHRDRTSMIASGR